MFNFFRNKSINQINQITVFFIATITILLIVGLFANRYSNHQNELEKLKSDYITSQKQLIKKETQRVLKYIKYKNKITNTTNIKQLQKDIVDTVEHMRDTRNGSGYIFIYTFEGINVADPILKENIQMEILI